MENTKSNPPSIHLVGFNFPERVLVHHVICQLGYENCAVYWDTVEGLVKNAARFDSREIQSCIFRLDIHHFEDFVNSLDRLEKTAFQNCRRTVLIGAPVAPHLLAALSQKNVGALLEMPFELPKLSELFLGILKKSSRG